MTILRFDRTTRHFGPEGQGVTDLSIELHRGEFVVWLGHSGSGKTTAARLAAGLEQPDSGDVYLGDAKANHVPAYRRAREMGCYYVLQNSPLYPSMSVHRNLRLGGLVPNGREFDQIARLTIATLFPETKCEERFEQLMRKRSDELSGGERQRIALAKAMIIRAPLTLLDEPLANVDAPNRTQIRRAIRRLAQEHGMTVVWITHDQEEAVAVADRISVFRNGRVLQTGSADELRRHPAHVEVANFISTGLGVPINILPAEHPLCRNAQSEGDTETQWANDMHKRSVIGIRCDALHVHHEAGDQTHWASGTVDLVERTASGELLIVRLDDCSQLSVLTTVDTGPWTAGERVAVRAKHLSHVFDADTGLAIGQGRERGNRHGA